MEKVYSSKEFGTSGKGGEKRSFNEEGGSMKKPRLKNRGMNKNRGPTFRVDRENQLCPILKDRKSDADPKCLFEGCKYTHDLDKYLEQKEPDLGDECYVYNTRGYCPRGVTCRFGSKHVTKDGLNIVNKELYEEWKSNPNLHTINSLNYEVVEQLRKRCYNFSKSSDIISKWEKERKEKSAQDGGNVEEDNESEKRIDEVKVDVDCGAVEASSSETKLATNGGNVKEYNESEKRLHEVKDNGDCGAVETSSSEPKLASGGIGPVFDYDEIRLRNSEKKKIDWRGKLFLSPLTTVGNLPFRRICKELGADVTCGEMAVAVNLLQGKSQEWALTKRHGTEDIFGVQICGNRPELMTKCAQLVQEQANVDFVDINVGCPIDLIYKQGAGSGLLTRKKMLFSIVKCMKSVLDVPLTVKTRTGVHIGKNVVHTYMQDLVDAGADLITIHGRTKDQRYAKLADWDYVEQCARIAPSIPVVGNGDILSYEDYNSVREKCPSAASIMIGRGALYKPWIFKEIKEQRHWDISSQERFQILQKFTNYGLEHWGSDTKGVESTRRFLLEWLSFLYRYVPVGLMEGLPQKMNERPPKFQGRDELEELMASPNCADWIKISEMLLGPVPDCFQFVPKHKANAW